MDKSVKKIKAQVWSNPWHFLAFGFGSGLSPKAPGTMGTLAAIPVYWLMASYFTNLTYLIVTIIFAIAGITICQKVSDDLQVHDFSGIVWDEIVGYLITMMFLPLTLQWIILGFILFRFFDILKPWPISWLDKKVAGGLGIMVDDIVAGIFSWAILYTIYVNQWLVNL